MITTALVLFVVSLVFARMAYKQPRGLAQGVFWALGFESAFITAVLLTWRLLG